MSQRTCELYINLLMGQHKEKPSEGYDALALQMSERMRDRNLVEFLLAADLESNREADLPLLKR